MAWAERSCARRRGNVWLLDGRIVYGNDHVELRRLLRESRNWLVIGDLPYLPWVNGSQPYFEQTTNRREAVFLFALNDQDGKFC